jgi:hypothetical protein
MVHSLTSSYANIINALARHLSSRELMEKSRLDPRHFTRERKLTFPVILSFLLSSVQGAVQSELNTFFADLRNRVESIRKVSAQAFSEARYKISSRVFDDVNRELIAQVAEQMSIPRWHGLRVVAGDGTVVQLTMLKNGVRSIVSGLAFGLYLPGIELFLSFKLQLGSCSERQMLFESLSLLCPNDLLLLDRGFPCRWRPAVLIARRIHFCIRCDLSHGFKVVREFLLSGESERVVTLRAPNRRDAEDYECPVMPTTVRLVRVLTPNGRIHVVMTSLLDTIAFPATSFAALYHSRWRVEEAFKRIKHRLSLEHTSGLSWHAANQDFGAKVIFDNLNALAAYVATDAHLDPDSSYKINRTQEIQKIKENVGRWLLAGAATARRLKSLMKEIAMDLQKLVPDRTNPHKPQPKPHLSHAYKAV